MPAWPLALACLPAGFAVADATGARALGGVVLVAVGAATVLASPAPLGRRVAWGAVALGAFVASHLLAHPLGAWPAVAVTAGIAGAAGWLLLDGGAPVLRRPATT